MITASRREWGIAVGGGLALAATLVTILRWPAAEAPVPPPPPPMPAAQPAALAPPAPPPAAPAAPAAPADLALTGLRTGPDGGMAIIRAGGRDVRLAPGRALPGGWRLLRVEPGRAILAGPGGERVLAFADAPAAGAGPSPPPGGDPTPWRLALRRDPAGGWRLGSLAELPVLERAGLRTGDVLIAANGQELLSEEKIIELPQELAANGQLILRYRRGGVEREAKALP